MTGYQSYHQGNTATEFLNHSDNDQASVDFDRRSEVTYTTAGGDRADVPHRLTDPEIEDLEGDYVNLRIKTSEFLQRMTNEARRGSEWAAARVEALKPLRQQNKANAERARKAELPAQIAGARKDWLVQYKSGRPKSAEGRPY